MTHKIYKITFTLKWDLIDTSLSKTVESSSEDHNISHIGELVNSNETPREYPSQIGLIILHNFPFFGQKL